MTQAIIMLTRHDVTVPDALEVFHELKGTGITNIGFKDIGLSGEESGRLVSALKEQNMHVYFEIVSSDEHGTVQSAKAAAKLGVEYIIGGRYYKAVHHIAAAHNIAYYPYVGRIVGHPCVLEGSIELITAGARECDLLGVDGLNLLAYRYNGDTAALLRCMIDAVSIPMIIAGGVDSIMRIRSLVRLHISAFTIGTALFEKSLLPGLSFQEQVRAVLREVDSR